MDIRWYFDVVSPFAWLQWPRVRELAAAREVSLRPILFAAVLERLGQLGPAEIPGKREFTYRHVLWRARRAGRTLRFPPAHPFNPLPALRLCVASGCTPQAVETVFDWIWACGNGVDTPDAIAALGAELGLADPGAALAAPEVKESLRSFGGMAVADGVFGVPSLVIGQRPFWGEDATDMALDYLADPAGFDDAEMRRVAELPVGVRRR